MTLKKTFPLISTGRDLRNRCVFSVVRNSDGVIEHEMIRAVRETMN